MRVPVPIWLVVEFPLIVAVMVSNSPDQSRMDISIDPQSLPTSFVHLAHDLQEQRVPLAVCGSGRRRRCYSCGDSHIVSLAGALFVCQETCNAKLLDSCRATVVDLTDGKPDPDSASSANAAISTPGGEARARPPRLHPSAAFPEATRAVYEDPRRTVPSDRHLSHPRGASPLVSQILAPSGGSRPGRLNQPR